MMDDGGFSEISTCFFVCLGMIQQPFKLWTAFGCCDVVIGFGS